MSIVWVAFSVTARILPFGLKATWAAPTPEPDSARRESVRFRSLPSLVMRTPLIVSARSFRRDTDERAMHVDAHGTIAHELLVGQLEAIGGDVEDGHVVAAGVDGEQVIPVGRDGQRRLTPESGRGAAAARGDGFLVGQRPFAARANETTALPAAEFVWT